MCRVPAPTRMLIVRIIRTLPLCSLTAVSSTCPPFCLFFNFLNYS